MQVLDFSALEHNAQFFKERLGSARLCAVVKNNAYGHGIEHVARYLDGVADCFAVGSVAEAKQIEFASADKLILLPQDFFNTEVAVKSGFALTADSFATLDIVCKVADKLRAPACVHVKIDSGMSRLGFGQNDIANLLDFLRSHPQIGVEGVYSHFYGSNAVGCDKQLETFLPCASAIEQTLNRPLIKHIANTGGALLDKRYHLDMARIGLGLYGYGDKNLAPVKTIVAPIVSVKKVLAGSVVGYGDNCVAPVDTQVAVLNVGYAHGFSRSLVNSIVKINGKDCKVLAVCMAMIIVDVSGVAVKVGDSATILGDGVNISNDIVSVYELLCNLK